MAPPITSVTIYPIKADVTIESPDSQEGKSWKSIVKTILAQQGAQRLHWGRQVENPNLVEVLVGRLTILEWETPDNSHSLLHVRSFLNSCFILFLIMLCPEPFLSVIEDAPDYSCFQSFMTQIHLFYSDSRIRTFHRPYSNYPLMISSPLLVPCTFRLGHYRKPQETSFKPGI